MKISFPSWHADARAMREKGMKLGQIVMILRDAGINVSESRVSQVTGQNWMDYIEKDRLRAVAARSEVVKAKKEGRLPDVKQATKQAVVEWQKEKQMSDRHFEMVTASDPTDVNHRVRITCSHEGCDKSLIFVRRGLINPVHAAKWFRDKGWHVGNGPRHDLCDDHNPKNGHKRANGGIDIITKHENIQDGALPMAGVVPTIMTLPPEIHPAPTLPDEMTLEERYPDDFNRAPPNQIIQHPGVPPQMILPEGMTRADRRVIHNKLEDVYVDEFIGYKTGWDDLKVAADLGCDVYWVALVREENFGPEITVARQRADLAKLGDDIDTKVQALLSGLIPDIQASIKLYDRSVEEMDRKLERFDSEVAAIHASLIEFNNKLKELKHD